jgi:hypothetical protein
VTASATLPLDTGTTQLRLEPYARALGDRRELHGRPRVGAEHGPRGTTNPARGDRHSRARRSRCASVPVGSNPRLVSRLLRQCPEPSTAEWHSGRRVRDVLPLLLRSSRRGTHRTVAPSALFCNVSCDTRLSVSISRSGRTFVTTVHNRAAYRTISTSNCGIW